MRLANFDASGFLRDCWQKQPRLIRNPWDCWQNPLAADELAGLACEEGIEARLITRAPDGWAAEPGPLREARFNRLGKMPWTLLVQAVDQHVPEVADLMDPFRFVPNWRIDDVMVSYASEGGGVGPHFDHYDVFLIQGAGRRRWQVGDKCDDGSPLLPHDELRLLANFTPRQEWVLDPGDILYLPPGFAHDGVALDDDCMTYSIGFRAPSRAELISHWCDHLLDELVDDDRYGDPDLEPAANPGEIPPAALARLHAMITERLADRDAFARWFGSYTSAPKYPDLDWSPERPITPAALRKRLAIDPGLRRNPASRFAFVRQQDGTVLLFVDGDCMACDDAVAAFAQELCGNSQMTVAAASMQSAPVIDLIAGLLNRGCVALADEA